MVGIVKYGKHSKISQTCAKKPLLKFLNLNEISITVY